MNTLWTLMICWGLATLTHAELPQLQAETSDPITPDTMGGCSIRCSIQWSVTFMKKGSDQESRIIVLSDNKANTAWRDDAGGIGAKFIFHFPEKLPAELDGQVPFYGIDLANGDLRNEEARKASARLKKARMYYNNKPVRDITFPDTPRWAKVGFDDIMVRSGDTMTLEVLEVYPGASSKTLVLSEIVLQGAH